MLNGMKVKKFRHKNLEFVFSFFMLSMLLIQYDAFAEQLTTEPPIAGVEIVNYTDAITQEAGTTASYAVRVKNIGRLDLTDVHLTITRLSPGWYAFSEPIALSPGESGVLYYYLSVPKAVVGSYVFSINLYGSYGSLLVSDTDNPVKLDILQPTTTTQATTTQPAVAQPAISPNETTTTTKPTEITLIIPEETTTTVPISALVAYAKENPAWSAVGVLTIIAAVLAIIRFKLV